jgi:hypothetical protein
MPLRPLMNRQARQPIPVIMLQRVAVIYMSLLVKLAAAGPHKCRLVPVRDEEVDSFCAIAG